MRILSIETSCDDTGITIMEAKGGLKSPTFTVLSDQLAVQSIHAQFGGVFPMKAKIEHEKNLPILLAKALEETKLTTKKKPVDLIAVTYGPGLEPCLWTGIVFAQELAKKWNVPIIPTNHMEGHIISAYGKSSGTFKIPKIEFPMLCLLVSGGHTELVLSKSFQKYKIIGKTRDDAAGEAFDKVGRMMGLDYPAGPKISKLAEKIRNSTENQTFRGHNFSAEKLVQSLGRRLAESPKSLFSVSFPRPMMYSKDFDFSFSGLKTAVLYTIQKIKKLDENKKSEIALEFENAVVETLIHKTKKAAEKYKIKSLIVSGGVAANNHLRSEMGKAFAGITPVIIPPRELTRDKSLMIGIAGYLQYIKRKGKVPNPKKIKATGNLKLG